MQHVPTVKGPKKIFKKTIVRTISDTFRGFRDVNCILNKTNILKYLSIIYDYINEMNDLSFIFIILKPSNNMAIDYTINYVTVW